MWKKNMPKLIVDNDDKKEEKISDVALVTKSEFQTSAEFSQHIEKKAVAAGNYIDVLVEYCTKNDIEISFLLKRLLTAYNRRFSQNRLFLSTVCILSTKL